MDPLGRDEPLFFFGGTDHLSGNGSFQRERTLLSLGGNGPSRWRQTLWVDMDSLGEDELSRWG